MAAAALGCCGCLSDNSYIPFTPDEEDTERKEQPAAPQTYDISAAAAVYQTKVSELSSICLKSSPDGFYAVSDEGDVFELDMEGKTVSRLYSKGNHDWEGIDCSGTDIYLMEESESALYRLSSGQLTKVAVTRIPGGGVSGRGPEGLMIDGDIAYIGNQESPTRIVRYSLKESKQLSYYDVSFVRDFISDLCLDPVDNTMWIVDSKGEAFYHCSLDGQLIATYNIPFVKQAEAIAVDHANSLVWIGCDVTSKLYKIEIEL